MVGLFIYESAKLDAIIHLPKQKSHPSSLKISFEKILSEKQLNPIKPTNHYGNITAIKNHPSKNAHSLKILKQYYTCHSARFLKVSHKIVAITLKPASNFLKNSAFFRFFLTLTPKICVIPPFSSIVSIYVTEYSVILSSIKMAFLKP